MVKKKTKAISIDSMFKTFMKSYDIPSRQDIDKLSAKIDRLEKLIRQTSGKTIKVTPGNSEKEVVDKSDLTASGAVLKVIKNSRQGADFARIQAKTGFEDKKLRNIIFRLNKIGKIERKTRGIYTVIGE
jgi:hypothetical protein